MESLLVVKEHVVSIAKDATTPTTLENLRAMCLRATISMDGTIVL
jgi:hypothetical protein